MLERLGSGQGLTRFKRFNCNCQTPLLLGDVSALVAVWSQKKSSFCAPEWELVKPSDLPCSVGLQTSSAFLLDILLPSYTGCVWVAQREGVFEPLTIDV